MPRCGVERHAGPVVGGAGVFPGVGGPGVVAEFAGMRDGVEGPAQRAGADIEGADVAGRRGFGFRVATADDDEVLVDNAGSGESDGLLGVVAAQVLAQVDAALFAKTGDGFAGSWIERVEVVQHAREEAGTLAVGPVAQSRAKAGYFCTPESKVQSRAPVAASRAMTFPEYV